METAADIAAAVTPSATSAATTSSSAASAAVGVCSRVTAAALSVGATDSGPASPHTSPVPLVRSAPRLRAATAWLSKALLASCNDSSVPVSKSRTTSVAGTRSIDTRSRRPRSTACSRIAASTSSRVPRMPCSSLTSGADCHRFALRKLTVSSWPYVKPSQGPVWPLGLGSGWARMRLQCRSWRSRKLQRRSWDRLDGSCRAADGRHDPT
eukprot:4845181-Prymnesium_polylepis.1